MALSRTLACLAVAVLLTACSRSGGVKQPTSPPGVTDPPGKVSEGPTPPVGPNQSAAKRPIPEVLAQLVEGALQRVAFKSGDTVDAEGIYFMNAATGAGEAFTRTGNDTFWSRYISGDNRFAIVGAGTNGYIIDRQSKSVWRWDPQQVKALLAGAGGFLFAEVEAPNGEDTGRYFWTGPDFKPKHVFNLGNGWWSRSALLSQDGSRVALLRPGGGAEQPQVAVVTLVSGEIKRLAGPAVDYVGAAVLERYGQGFDLEILDGKGPEQRRTRNSVRRRFDWDGNVLKDIEIPGENVFFSPDGKWVAWEAQPVGTLAPATVIADAATLKPRLQALGVTTCFQSVGSGGTRWLSDSSGLVVDTAGGYRILTLNGDVQERRAFAGRAWSGEPQPAPDDPDRFAIGRTAITDGGSTKTVGVTLKNHVIPAGWGAWGDSGAELRFVLPPKPGGGACSERPPMPVRVQMPAEKLSDFPLVVHGTGSCLRLRDQPHGTGATRTCLPDGILLMPVRQNDNVGETTWLDEGWWLFVKTEKGETGWVSLKDGYVTWAPP